MVNLLLLHIHADKTALRRIQPNKTTITLLRIIDGQRIAAHVHQLHLAVLDIYRHFLTAHLVEIVERVLHHTQRTSVSPCVFHGSVDDINDHTVRGNLLVLTPANRFLVQVYRRIAAPID